MRQILPALLLISLSLGGGLPGTAPPAHADITRGCKGVLWVTVLSSGGGKPVSVLDGALSTYEGIGGCKNTIHANDCRRNARNAIFTCGRDLWATRWNRTLPSSCQGRGLGARGMRPFPANPQGNVYDLKHGLEHFGCCSLASQASELTLMLEAVSWGNKGCGDTQKRRLKFGEVDADAVTLTTSYRADCRALRAQGLCGGPRSAKRTGGATRRAPVVERNTDRPGNDYRSFGVSRGGYRTCQTACRRDKKCKSWTFVKRGIQGPTAKCWLKTAVPPARRSDCCISGRN